MVAAPLGAPADPSDDAPRVVEVPRGATARSIGPLLEEAGVVADAGRFAWYVRLTGEGGCIKAGRFELRPSMDARAILEALCGPPLPEDVPFTVVEGWRIRDVDAALARAGWIEPGAYERAAARVEGRDLPFPLPEGATSLEGYLFPDTYALAPGRFSPERLVERQLAAFAERFWTPHRAEVEASGRTLHEVVTMASMVEREEPTPDRRPLVAGILWKRLDNGWNLGVDATSRYPLADWNDRVAFLRRLRDPSDPYNTRLRPGLPPTPIGNPGLDALLAALRPEESEYWYYLHDDDRVLHPARTAAEHEANRRRYGVW